MNRHHLAFLLLFVLPAAAGAQVATGTSASGLAYEASGSGEAIVLIHAFSVDRRMWAPQIAALERRFRVIRYDLRGHGKSEGPSAPYATYEDLRSVLDALGVTRATLIGLSAGSEVATDFALAYPEGDSEGAAKLWAATPIMAMRNDLTAAATVNELVMSNTRIWTYRTNPVRPLAPPAIKRLSEIKCPALVILGEQDLPHIKEIGELLVGGIAGARLVTVPRAGHIVNLDARDAFNQAVDTFLAAR